MTFRISITAYQNLMQKRFLKKLFDAEAFDKKIKEKNYKKFNSSIIKKKRGFPDEETHVFNLISM